MSAEAPEPAPRPARTVQELRAPAGSVDVIAVGASAGGVEALTQLVAALPRDLGAAVLVVLHVSEAGTSVMPAILDRAGPLPAASAQDGAALLPGTIHVAPPGAHLVVDDDRARLDRGPRENGHRPAIDPLLRTVSFAFGARAAGVILSGARDDGTAGLWRLKQRGGVALVQDPASAEYPSMPQSAIDHVPVDAILPLPELAAALARLAGRGGDRAPAAGGAAPPAATPPVAVEPSRFTCPDCGGVLTAYEDGSLQRYRCSIGHAYSFGSLVEAQSHQLESALWAAARTLEDRALLLRQLARQSGLRGSERAAAAFERRADAAASQATAIRDAIEHGATAVPPAPEDDERAAEPETMAE